MADVIVNIRGNADQLKQELENVGNGTPDSINVGRGRADNSRETLPPDKRIIDEVRNEIQNQRGGITPENLENARKSESERMEREISDKYSGARADMQRRMSSEYDDADRKIEFEKQRRIDDTKSMYDRDPLLKNSIDSQYDNLREMEYKKIGEKYDKEEKQIDDKEAEERINSEDELTNAIKDLTNEIASGGVSGSSSDPNSYLNKIRTAREEALAERDNAMTKEGAESAQTRISEYDELLKAGKKRKPTEVFDRTSMASQGMANMVTGITSGDESGAIMGGATAISGLSGMGAASAMKFNAYAALVAAAIGVGKKGLESNKGLTELAGMRGAMGGRTGVESWDYLANAISEPKAFGSTDYYSNFGLERPEFASLAVRGIRSRGIADDWYNQTIQGYGMEKTMGMEQGTISGAGGFDRYGQNVTDALSRMVSILSNIHGSGVTSGDFTRVQEKFDIQQSIMGSYMERADKPNYNVANNLLGAFSAVGGITQDKRLGTDIASFQGMVQNPQNDRMKALIFSTVADLFPKSQGRMDLLDRELRNPENEGKIIQSVMQRLKNQNGGTDTTLGYFTMKQLFPNIAPERMDAYQKAFTSGGDARSILKGDSTVSGVSDDEVKKFKAGAVQDATGLTAKRDEVVSKIGETVSDIYTWLSTKSTPVIPPTATGRAGNRSN